MSEPLLQVENLCTQFPTTAGPVRALDGVSLQVDPGEIVGVVGESGCGKTMLALSVLRLVPEPGRIVAGRIRFAGHDLLGMDEGAIRGLRGADLAMTFQDPMTALNPLTKVRAQIREAMTAHGRFRGTDASRRVVPLMQQVHIPNASDRAGAYPHEFSGGMRQRVLMAMGIANEPQLLIADEPTTAIDVTIQAEIIKLLQQLNHDLRMATLLITHDMAVVAGLCHRVVVMYAGRIVEEGPVEQIFTRPQHPYTWALLRAVPRIDANRHSRLLTIGGGPPDLADLPSGCKFHPRCRFRQERCTTDEPPLDKVEPAQQARCWVLMRTIPETARTTQRQAQDYPGSRRENAGSQRTSPDPLLRLEGLAKHFSVPGYGREPIKAVDGVDLEIRRGQILGLIGESGCGKTTLARLIAQLTPVTSGRVVFEDTELTGLSARKLRHVRRRLQVIFQDPFASLNPRMTVGDIIAEPLDNFEVGPRRQRSNEVRRLLEVVGLHPEAATRYPHEFSGGQRQRIGIARALALNPSLIICDEPVSALDVSVQAQVLNLLEELQQAFDLTYLFISHDLAVVRHLCDRIAVMYLGKIVEIADADDLYHHPQHPYTKVLLDAVPIPDPHREHRRQPTVLTGEAPSAATPPRGCRFHTRCPIARVPGICQQDEPLLAPHGHRRQLAACHFAGQPIHRPDVR